MRDSLTGIAGDNEDLLASGVLSNVGAIVERLEHLRLTQLDILDYCRNPNYTPRPHPEGYWPARDAVATAADWARTCEVFLSDLDELIAIVEDPETDLYTKIPWGGEHTILREILIIADHNSYHVGELAIMRQVMGTWPATRS